MGRYALVIGICRYRNIGNLTKPAEDAEAIAQLLEQHGNFQSVMRLPEAFENDRSRVAKTIELGADELQSVLRQFITEQARNGDALIYFSGHGFLVKDKLSQAPKGYLAPSDCVIQANASQEAIGQLNGIDLDSLNTLFAESQLSSLVVLLDCCNSGYFIEKTALQKTLTAFTENSGYYLIAACRSFERAWESTAYSVFTQALLAGLTPEKADQQGQITCDDLFKTVEQNLRNTGQEPIRATLGSPIVLVQYPPKAPTRAESQFNRENPYVGLEAFSASQSAYFFGREEAVQELLKRLNTGRFLTVIGSSGCGKSSLIKAGLLPELQRDRLVGSSHWAIATLTPTNQPCHALTKALERHTPATQPLVLFIDQFEEVFTLCEDEAQRQDFIRQMASLVKTPDCLTRVIVAIRGDFLDRCAFYPETADLINEARPTTYVVPPLSPAELEAAIERPALSHGVAFDPGLVSQMVADVIDRPGALPLLQYALKELWRVCITDLPTAPPRLTWQGYQQIDGVSGALNQRASDLYRHFSPNDRTFIRRLFMELVQFGEEQEATRRRASWEQIRSQADSPEQSQRVVEILAGSQQRLIITDERTVEVAHEALLSEWSLLRGWIEEDRESIRLKRQLETDCQEWQERFQRSDEALLTGARLAAIQEWNAKQQPKLTAIQTAFLQQSLEKRDRIQQEREHQLERLADQQRQLRQEADENAHLERQKRRLAKRGWLLVAGLLMAIAAAALFFAQGSIREKTVSQQGQVETLTTLAEIYFKDNQQLEALTTSIQALGKLKESNLPPEEYVKRLQPIVYGVRERDRWEAHSASIYGLSFNHSIKNLSPTDIAIVSSDYDASIKLWNIKGELIKELPKQEEHIYSIALSHNGKYLASVGSERRVRLWNLLDQGLEYAFPVQREKAYSITFSHDDTTILASGENGVIRLWTVSENQRDKARLLTASELLGEQYQNQNAPDIFNAAHPKKNIVAYSGFADNSIGVFDWSSKQPFRKMGKHETAINQITFSPDGLLIATSDKDGTIKLWSFEGLAQLRPLAEIAAHNAGIFTTTFDQSSRLLASGGADQKIKIWNVHDTIEAYASKQKFTEEQNGNLFTLEGHTSDINNIDLFSSKVGGQTRQLVVSAGDDKTIRIWELRTEVSPLELNSLESLLEESCDFTKDYRTIHFKAQEGVKDCS